MIAKAIHNRLSVAEARENGIRVYPSEELLGSMKSVKNFAAFGMNHKEELETLRANLLLDYCEGEFTKEEFNAYRMGLDSMMIFFDNAEADMKSYLKENEEKNKKSVG